jgi:hypothetical protein
MQPSPVSPPTSSRTMRSLLGSAVVVRTIAATWRGTLLSCVKDSAWLVVNDTDVMIDIDDIIYVKPDHS